jgi:hypothetical protein
MNDTGFDIVAKPDREVPKATAGNETLRLMIHRETKEIPICALVVANMFDRFVSNQLDRAVIDQTGLTAAYDFKLQYMPDPAETMPAPPGTDKDIAPPAPDNPAIFTALTEQLGLKLEARKGPVEIVVVDRAERPSEN